MNNPNERNELIKQTPHEGVSGGATMNCSISCRIFSADACHIDLCEEPGICQSRAR